MRAWKFDNLAVSIEVNLFLTLRVMLNVRFWLFPHNYERKGESFSRNGIRITKSSYKTIMKEDFIDSFFCWEGFARFYGLALLNYFLLAWQRLSVMFFIFAVFTLHIPSSVLQILVSKSEIIQMTHVLG